LKWLGDDLPSRLQIDSQREWDVALVEVLRKFLKTQIEGVIVGMRQPGGELITELANPSPNLR
jgi:hypothetical protein